jgi:hypothetical protein
MMQRSAIALAAWLLVSQLLRPSAWADEPTGTIPSIRATVNGLRFFESGDQPVPLEQRRYDQRFFADPARFIHWELNLAHPAPGRRTSFTVEEVWRGPGVGYRKTRVFSLENHWNGSNWWGSARLVLPKTVAVPSPREVFRCRGVTGEWGPCDSTSQVAIYYWPRGAYRVDLFVDKQRIATGAFSMLGKNDIDGEMRARASDESAPTGSITPLKGRVNSLRFFDAGPPASRAAQRRYASQFPRATRSIGWEIDVKHAASGRWLPVTFEAFWYYVDRGGRRLVQRKVLQTAVLADWTDTHFFDDSDPSSTGSWQTGSYRVELYVEGKKVASASFEIR